MLRTKPIRLVQIRARPATTWPTVKRPGVVVDDQVGDREGPGDDRKHDGYRAQTAQSMFEPNALLASRLAVSVGTSQPN